jgi:hypothetical protein
MMNVKNFVKGIMFFLFLVLSVYAEKPKDVPDGWWNQVQKDIASSEYNITWQEKPAIDGLSPCWQAPNRAQNIRAYFTNNGPRVVRRTEEKPSWIWGLELVGMRNVECGMRNGKS